MATELEKNGAAVINTPYGQVVISVNQYTLSVRVTIDPEKCYLETNQRFDDVAKVNVYPKSEDIE